MRPVSSKPVSSKPVSSKPVSSNTPNRPVTIRDVAKRAGVSPITASRALSKPHLVKPETRLKVEAAADDLKFISNHAAGSLSNRRTNMVGIIVPTLTNSIFAETIQAITSALMPAGIQALIGSNEYSPELEEEIIKTFISHRAEALILTGHTRTKRAEEIIKQYGIPTIEIWNINTKSDNICVGMSNHQAAFEMTSFLIGRGYRRIGYIGGVLENNDRSQDRIRGYKDALAEHAIPLDTALLRESTYEFASGASAMKSLLTKVHDLDCVFGSSDIIAFGAMMECQRNGIKIPDDIALAGFDDAVIGAISKPALTTISVPRQRIGLKAADIVTRLINGETGIPQIHDLGFELKVRDTT